MATPLPAQQLMQPSGLPSFTLDAAYLYPLTAGVPVGGQVPSGRFVLEHSLHPNLALHAGVLHLAPANSGLWAGVLGVRLDVLQGRFRAYTFGDAGFGRIQAAVDSGGYQPLGGTYVPRLRRVTVASLGGGVGLGTEWALRPSLSLTGAAGYWYYPTGEPTRIFNGVTSGQVAVNGLFAGIGLRLALPFGGRTPMQPVSPIPGAGPLIIQIEEPAAWAGTGTRGLRAVPKSSIRVIGTVRDPAGVGVREVRVNGQVAALRPLDSTGSLVRFLGFAGIDRNTKSVEVSARARDGRQAASVYDVTPAQVAAHAGPDTTAGKRYAVVIGISDYTDTSIPALEYADDDARSFYDFLISQRAGLGGIPKDDIVLLLNKDATYRNMRTALYTFLQKATDQDMVYIYIAAHGAPDPNRLDDLYILPYDAEANDIPGTGFPMKDVREAIEKLYARHVVLLTDACHSGAIGMGSVSTRSAGGGELNAINRAFLQDLQATTSGLAILTASEAAQLSREGEQWGGGHGVFTYYLLKGLDGAADTDGDHIVRLGEVMEYVREQVRRATNNGQIPAIGNQTFDRYLPMAIVPPGQDRKDTH
ncbi:MAG TPA: caspase family protein, partial [Longimicrobiales bacterium]|nr:caspase family protein [Longimicrobiales bacterium]